MHYYCYQYFFLSSKFVLAYIVSITVSPNDTVCQLATVTFTADISGCASFTMQWKINGNNVAGATAATYTIISLVDGDQVSCEVSSLTCSGSPVTSNIILMTVISCTGINQIENNISFSFSPNPSNGIFALQTKTAKATDLTVTNTLGEKILEQKIVSENTQINLSKQPNGIYFVQMKSEKQILTKKLLLQK